LIADFGLRISNSVKNTKMGKALVFLACLVPLGRLGLDAWRDHLGANPIEVITRSTGTWTLVFLLATLAVTPLRRISRWDSLIKFRRMLGLFAFFYASLHFATYIWLDQFFDFRAAMRDIAQRPFITAGFLSFVLLIPLAVTSTRGMIRRLGRRWQQIHRLVYLIAIGGVVHYLWLVKADRRDPLIYGAALSLLLLYRLLSARRLWMKLSAGGGAGAKTILAFSPPMGKDRPDETP
jgi:sulfoxide reductase heme-binding subunit YedZ